MGLLKALLDRITGRKTIYVTGQDWNKTLEDAIGNAVLIIMTASKNAIALDADTVATIIEAKNMHQKSGLDTQTESDFWNAYEQAAQAIKPITIDSIKATYDPHPTHNSLFSRLFLRKNVPLSRRCASNYKIISLVTLLFLITIQIYWYIGWSVTTDINSQTQTISQLQNDLTTLTHQATERTDPLRFRDRQSVDVEVIKLKQQINEHSDWKDAASHHLQNWNQVWSDMDLLTLQPWQIPNYADFPQAVQRRIQFVAAGNTLQAITGYILPILYGLIGACFYILRQLPKEIDSMTFSMNSYIDYSLRMAQGPLAGILTSYFITANQEPSLSAAKGTVSASQIHTLDAQLSTLSPLAVAFLAGYSVEFIFRFIDKMLNTSIPDQPFAYKNQTNYKPVKRKRSRKFAEEEKNTPNPENKNKDTTL